MSYTTGSSITAADYNTLASTLQNIYGVGTGSKGYGLTSLSISTKTAKITTVKALDWSQLRDMAIYVANQQGNTLPSSTNLSSLNFTAGNTIPGGYDWATLVNTLNAASSTSASLATSSTTTTTRGTYWGTNNSATLSATFSITWSSSDAARYFFNTGGQIQVSLSHPPTAQTGIVNSLTVTNAGSGYTAVPSVTLGTPTSGLPGLAQAFASATINTINNTITGISLNGTGSGYTSAPAVTISSGGGSGGTAVANLATACKNVLSLDSNATSLIGQTSPTIPQMLFNGTTVINSDPAQGHVACSYNGSVYTITAIVIDYGGSYSGTEGYQIVTYNTSGQLISSISGSCNMSGLVSRVSSFTVTNAGGGYTFAPTVTLSGGGGSNASGIAAITHQTSAITGVNMTSKGAGYIATPDVSVATTDGNGSGGTMTANVSYSNSNANWNTACSTLGTISVKATTFSGNSGSGQQVTNGFFSFISGVNKSFVTNTYNTNYNVSMYGYTTGTVGSNGGLGNVLILQVQLNDTSSLPSISPGTVCTLTVLKSNSGFVSIADPTVAVTSAF